MQKITTLSLVATVALFIGCGGGSAPASPTSLNTQVEDDTSGQDTQGTQTISSANLANMTIVADYVGGSKYKNIQKVMYIFEPNNQAIVVIDYADGSRKVAHGEYNESDGNNVAILSPVYDDETPVTYMATGIASPSSFDMITVGESTAYPYKVTSIVSNEDNGIDEATVVSIEVTSTLPDDSSNENIALSNSTALYIYNNISASAANEAYSQLNTAMYDASLLRYDGSSALRCSNYGYTSLMSEDPATDGNPAAKVYMKSNQYMCIEYDFSNATGQSGSSYLAVYK